MLLVLILLNLLFLSSQDINIASEPYAYRSLPRDLIISVKTTASNHRARVVEILDTWFRHASDHVFFVTDANDPVLWQKVNAQLIATDCDSGHNIHALNCKMARELELFVQADASWSCHFDDDSYVNIRELRLLLDSFDYGKDYYLGKPSTSEPVRLVRPDGASEAFWFGTGGAGICMSRSALRKLEPYIRNGRFEQLGVSLGVPDDVTLGYIMGTLLDIPLTVVEAFHSHLENLTALDISTIRQQACYLSDLTIVTRTVL
ncbi:fringe [Aphelenchoides avenae]|nr:fringe [Aphelenchus avenae]